MTGKPRMRPDLGRSTKVLTGDGGYRRAAEDERASWRELDVAKDDWLYRDALAWRGRLAAKQYHLGDLKVGAVLLYTGAMLRHKAP